MVELESLATFESTHRSIRRDMERSRLLGRRSSPDAWPRSSLDTSVICSTDCKVQVFDEARGSQYTDHQHDLLRPRTAQKFSIPGDRRSPGIPDGLVACLDSRRTQETRWIMVTGWASAVATELSRRMLDGHNCLDLQCLDQNMHGGPIKCLDDSYFVWVQTVVWCVDRTDNVLSVSRCSLRMVVCLPTPTTAGTVITHVCGGNVEAVNRVSQLLAALLDQHSMGTDAMQCVWVLAFSILRAVTEQLNSAFHVFDPLSEAEATLPHMNRMPHLLQQAGDLARIERYTSGLGEIVAFFDVVRSFQQSQTSEPRNGRPRAESPDIQNCRAIISSRSNLESELVKQRISHTQELCRTCIKQYDNMLQMMLFHTGTDIAMRLDRGSKVAERLAGIGLAVAALSGLTSPLAVIIGFFGMNVQEFTDGASKTLFDFWQVALPMMVVSIGGLSIILIRLMSGTKT